MVIKVSLFVIFHLKNLKLMLYFDDAISSFSKALGLCICPHFSVGMFIIVFG